MRPGMPLGMPFPLRGIAVCAYLLKSRNRLSDGGNRSPSPFLPIFSLFVHSNFHAVIDISAIL